MDGYSEKLFACALLELTEARIVSPAEIGVRVFGGVYVGVCEGVAEAVGVGVSVGVNVSVTVGVGIKLVNVHAMLAPPIIVTVTLVPFRLGLPPSQTILPSDQPLGNCSLIV